jgi:hypothetical protein
MKQTDLTRQWSTLRIGAAGQVGAGLRLGLVSAKSEVRIFAAIEMPAGRTALVVQCPLECAPFRLGTLRFRNVGISVGHAPGLPEKSVALTLVLLDEDFAMLFGEMARHVCDEVAASDSAVGAVNAVAAVIERWRSFLDTRRPPLPSNEVRGLIGELVALDHLAESHGAAAALSSWKAPDGSIRDFECPDRTIEVKTYSPSQGASVRISDPLQLVPDHNVPLFLYCQELGRSTAPDLTLPGHVSRLHSNRFSSPALVADLDKALLSRGYSPEHAALYSDGYAIGPAQCFEVRDGFPRLHPSQLHPAVTDVTYSIPLSSLEPFSVDPAKAFWTTLVTSA